MKLVAQVIATLRFVDLVLLREVFWLIGRETRVQICTLFFLHRRLDPKAVVSERFLVLLLVLKLLLLEFTLLEPFVLHLE